MPTKTRLLRALGHIITHDFCSNKSPIQLCTRRETLSPLPLIHVNGMFNRSKHEIQASQPNSSSLSILVLARVVRRELYPTVYNSLLKTSGFT